ncbi:hypothetical protein TWF694_001226 [Orbilia ellipsospora]|uniref:Uncharacterized protein n=1 Tax=Orbilia ellipsospora TaxID=2528407 RepID=A0AAV9XSV2_9PEZI
MAHNQFSLPATAASSLRTTFQSPKTAEAILLEACRMGVAYPQVRTAFCHSFNPKFSMYTIDLKILDGAQSLQVKATTSNEYFEYLIKLLEERMAILKREEEKRQQVLRAERALVQEVMDLTLDQQELNARRALKLRAKQRLEKDRGAQQRAANAIRRREYRERISRFFKS